MTESMPGNDRALRYPGRIMRQGVELSLFRDKNMQASMTQLATFGSSAELMRNAAMMVLTETADICCSGLSSSFIF